MSAHAAEVLTKSGKTAANDQVLAGEHISNSLAETNPLATARAICALSDAKRLNSRVFTRSTVKVLADAALRPRMTTYTLWRPPPAGLLSKLRTVLVTAAVGKSRCWRCPELVAAVIANPIRCDPKTAIHANFMFLMWRILGTNDARRMTFFIGMRRLQGCDSSEQCKLDEVSSFLQDAEHNAVPTIPNLAEDFDKLVCRHPHGPARSLAEACHGLGIKANINQLTVKLSICGHTVVDFLAPSTTRCRRLIRMAASRAILHQLARRAPKDRKDLADFPNFIDWAATTRNLRTKASRLQGVSSSHYRAVLALIVSGGCSTPARLRHLQREGDAGEVGTQANSQEDAEWLFCRP